MNISSVNNAATAFRNSGWLDRFDDDETERAARFIRRESSGDYIDDEKFDALMRRFAVEIVGWLPTDL